MAQAFPHLMSKRAFSNALRTVKVSEQKVKVGKIEINYVRSALEGESQKKTLVCLPGALGDKMSSLNEFLFNIKIV